MKKSRATAFCVTSKVCQKQFTLFFIEHDVHEKHAFPWIKSLSCTVSSAWFYTRCKSFVWMGSKRLCIEVQLGERDSIHARYWMHVSDQGRLRVLFDDKSLHRKPWNNTWCLGYYLHFRMKNSGIRHRYPSISNLLRLESTSALKLNKNMLFFKARLQTKKIRAYWSM